MSKPKLSILIPTLVTRREIRKPLMAKLDALAEQSAGKVEIIPLEDNRQRTIGAKRNELLQMASGEFSAMVDDDDDVTITYVYNIVKAIEDHPKVDCIGMLGEMRINNRFHKWFKHSTQYDHYFHDNKFYYRPPNHLNPIRTEIARQFKYTDSSFGEDTDWAMQLVEAKALKSEYFVTQPVYIYKYLRKKYF